MPIDFDPVFHTETMVKILREQGSTQYAMELAELILQKNPQHEGVRRLLEELREDARRAFERFKTGGRSAEAAQSVESNDSSIASDFEGVVEEGVGVEAQPELESSSPSAQLAVVEPMVAASAIPIEGGSDEGKEDVPEISLEGATPETPREFVAESDLEPEAIIDDPEPVRLTLVPSPPPPSRRESKILRLQSLLRRIQSLRKAAHAPQA